MLVVRGWNQTGFGAAFTDSVADVFWKLEEKAQQEVLASFFGPAGLNYTLCRLTINRFRGYPLVIPVITDELTICSVATFRSGVTPTMILPETTT